MKILLALAILLGACTDPSLPPAPLVFIQMTDTWGIPTGADVPTNYMVGAEQWEPLGFSFTDQDAGLPICDLDWWRSGVIDCQLELGLYLDEHLVAKIGSLGDADQMHRVAEIDSSKTNPVDQIIISAHEFGHLLLETGTHTADGIMSGHTSQMSAADKALACSSIDICI